MTDRNGLLSNRRTSAGVTLMELIMVVAVVAVVTLVAVPGMRSFVLDSRMSTVANDLSASIRLARSKAVAVNRDVIFQPKAGNWKDGWRSFVDQNANGSFDSGTDLEIEDYSGNGDFTASGTGASGAITFKSSGLPATLNPWPGPVIFCDEKGRGREIYVSSTGATRVVKLEADCAT